MKYYSAPKEIFYPYDTLSETEKKRIDQYKDEHNVGYDDIHVYRYIDPFLVISVSLKPIGVTDDGIHFWDESVMEIQDFVAIPRHERIYIVESHGGQHEDSWDHIEGIFADPYKALQHAKDVCDEYDIDESELPMTFEEYGNCNYGYPDCPEEGYDYNDSSLCDYYNTLIDRDGHTVDEFQEMENAEHLMNEDFSFCSVKSYVIDKTGSDMDRKSMTIWKDGNGYDIRGDLYEDNIKIQGFL